MKWHVVITDNANFRCVIHIIQKLKQSKGDSVSVFLTGRGVLVINDEEFHSLIKELDRCVVCEFSLEKYGVKEDLPNGVDVGGQFQNAELVSTSDTTVCL